MMVMLYMIPAVLIAIAPVFAEAQATATPIAQAFEHYEAIRVVLAEDKIDAIGTHANALAPLAGLVAGNDAQAAAERVAVAKTLQQAREQFGVLSSALLPKFLDAALPGVHAFMCPMKKNASWAQRSDKMANPYFGQAMLTCGNEIKPTHQRDTPDRQ